MVWTSYSIIYKLDTFRKLTNYYFTMTGSSACEHIHKTGDGAMFIFSTWWEYVIMTSLSLTGVVCIMEAASKTHFFILDLHAFHLWMCPQLMVMVFHSY